MHEYLTISYISNDDDDDDDDDDDNNNNSIRFNCHVLK